MRTASPALPEPAAVQPGPPGDGWIEAAVLLEPGSRALEERVDAFGERLGAERRGVAVSLLLEAYATVVATAGLGALIGGGRAPDPRAANVSLRFPPGGVPEALAVHHKGPRPGDGLDTLAGVAAGLLDGHLAPLVDRLAELRPGRGRRALWALVANACSAAILEAAERAVAEPDRADALAEADHTDTGSQGAEAAGWARPGGGLLLAAGVAAAGTAAGAGAAGPGREAGAQARDLLPLLCAARVRVLRYLPGLQRRAGRGAGNGAARRAGPAGPRRPRRPRRPRQLR
jgi:Ferric iron reductase FhuF-like transporter